MKERLKRELNKTYLILYSEGCEYEESYEIEMLVKNSLETILPIHALRIDGKIELYYDISSKQTLKSCVERVKLSADTVRRLFEKIDKMTAEMKEYLLDMENVLLDMEHIYTKEGDFYFCYCPWKRNEILTSFRWMLEEILGNIDYHDTEAVELCYHLYQSACKGEFHISEILKEHTKEEKPAEIETYFENYFQEEELPKDFIPEEQKKEKRNKQGVFRRVLKFFLKKAAINKLELAEEKGSCQFPQEELYQGCLAEEKAVYGHTEVLESGNDHTIFLEDMPIGRWKLRPLIPGYEEFTITGEGFLVGKKRDSVDGFIGRDTISRIHSRLFVRQERLFITDANSTNGTFVNGTAVAPGVDVEIFAGDRIMFADVGYECYNSL